MRVDTSDNEEINSQSQLKVNGDGLNNVIPYDPSICYNHSMCGGNKRKIVN